jgi:hypothetical protein
MLRLFVSSPQGNKSTLNSFISWDIFFQSLDNMELVNNPAGKDHAEEIVLLKYLF